MAKKGKRIIVYLKSKASGRRNYTTIMHRDLLQGNNKVVLKKYDPATGKHEEHVVVKK